MTTDKPFKFGVVEGFFGNSWSWQARTSYADFLARFGFNAYLYAPKSNTYLRKNWHQPFPSGEVDALQTLSQTYTKAGLDFGIGLSPFELYCDFNEKNKTHLTNKLLEINAIQPKTLCILFDDMRGDFSNLAQQQVEIMNLVLTHSNAENFIMCPTYYSYDPALSSHFGEMPTNYLEDLGRLLEADINIFWTGPKVISAHYPQQHLLEVTDKLQRKPMLWDNYPVNDARQLTNHLHLRPVENLNPNLKNLVSGHMANPMNQAFLSQLPLHALSQIYQDNNSNSETLFQQACQALCPPELGQMLIDDIEIFQELGLKNISAASKANIQSRYENFNHNPMVKEILAWLEGDYIFDPACLT